MMEAGYDDEIILCCAECDVKLLQRQYKWLY